jgi:hypothetical protein
MSEFKSSSFRNEDNSGAPDIVGVTSFTSPFYFVPPSGTTAQRPSGDGLAPGMLRFNTDIGRLEVWRGDHWGIILGESPNLGISTAAAPASSGTGPRGLIAGGQTAPAGTVTNTIEYVSISSLGNSIDFGDLITGHACFAPTGNTSSSTRGIFMGGGTPTRLNIIDFVTFSSTGDATDFGDLITSRSELGGCSNSTRGISLGGSPGPSVTNVIEYVTIASTGDAKDFGDLTEAKEQLSGCSSSVRGLVGGGSNPANTSRIEFITISTLGDAARFGDLTVARNCLGACSNAVRALFGGGRSASTSNENTIDFITIASTGNAQDFGDLTQGRGIIMSAFSSSTRGIWAGGDIVPATGRVNTMDYVTIMTTGNAVDFGDLTSVSRGSTATCSNAHGGL